MRAAVIWLLVFLVFFPAAPPCLAQDEPADPTGQVDVSEQDLRNLVDLLENDAQREIFVRDLKTLLKLKQEGEAKPEGDAIKPDEEAVKPEEGAIKPEEGVTEPGGDVTKPLIVGIETFSEKAAGEARRMIEKIDLIPGLAAELVDYFSNPGIRTLYYRLLWRFMAGLAVGLALLILFRRFVPAPPLKRPRPWRLARYAVSRFLFGIIPWLVMYLAVMAFFSTVIALTGPKRFLLEALLAILHYKAAYHAVRLILAPRHGHLRIVPATDETADLFWRWFRRLGRYSVFYYIIEAGLISRIGDPAVHFVLRGALLFVFPIMLTICAIKFSLHFRTRPGAAPADDKEARIRVRFKHHATETLRKYWMGPVVVYIWIIFLFTFGGYRAWFEYLFWATIGTIAVIGGALLLMSLLMHGFRLFVPLEGPLELRVYKAFGVLARIVTGMAALIALAYVWGFPVTSFLSTDTGFQVTSRAIAIAVTFGIVILVFEGSQFVTNRLIEEREGVVPSQKRKTLAPIVNTAVKAVAVFVGLVVVLERLSVNIGPILAGAGIIGLGVGLGAQSLVKDVINGLFILLQDMIAVGDVVQVGEKMGLVESIGLRAVRLRDMSGNVIIIPNGVIDSYTNMTKHFSQYAFDLGVAYREDPDEVMEILAELGREMQADPTFGPHILEPLEIMGLDRFDDSAVIIRARVTTRPGRQWVVGREFNRRIKKRFDERGIEMPFPHRTVFMGELKAGASPPLNVRMTPDGGAPGRSETKPAPTGAGGGGDEETAQKV